MAYNKLYDGTEFNYYNGSSKGNMMSRTAFSFGFYGSKTVENKYGYGYYSNIITLWTNMTASTTRCVKDIRVDSAPSALRTGEGPLVYAPGEIGKAGSCLTAAQYCQETYLSKEHLQ